MIEHSNIIFMPTISALGGIETYVYELVKKYYDLDIAVVCKSIDKIQKQRIEKYCRVYIHTNQQIKCDVAIISYNQAIIDYISKEAKIYQTIHADYTNKRYDHKPMPNKRITAFIAITKYLEDKMGDILKPNKVMLSYNPLTIEKSKTIVIVSATRLHQYKGANRMLELAKALDKAKVNYIWYVITNDIDVIKHPNIIFIKNRLDIDKWLNQADYVCLLSDTEACSYTLNEALYRNIPIITTPLPYLEEIGVKDRINSYIVNFDCSNVEDVANRITNIPKFEFKQLNDKYNEIFTNKKSKYEEEKKMKVKVKCIQNYFDMETNERKVINESITYDDPINHPNRCEWITSKERADHLVSKGLVEIKEVIKEEPKIEKAIIKEEPIKEIIKDKQEEAINKTKIEKKKKK